MLDVRSDTANATTYTFTAVGLGDLGSVASTAGDVYGANPHIRSPGRKAIVVVVHGEDDLATFGVNSVTIGGVAGTEKVDRGGGSTAINTAIYVWDAASLGGITGTDVVVTWSEGVTNCAIGVLAIDNLGILADAVASANSAVGSGEIALSPSPNMLDTNSVLIVGSSKLNAGAGELFIIRSGSGGGMQPTILYDGAHAEGRFAAAWTYRPQHAAAGDTQAFPVAVSWTGAGSFDVACIGLI